MPKPISILISDGTIGFGGARLSFRDLLFTLDKKLFTIHSLVRDQAHEFDELEDVVRHYFPYRFQFELGHYLRAKLNRLPGKLVTLCSLPLHLFGIFLPYSMFLTILSIRHRIKIIHLNNQLYFNLPSLLVARLLGIKVFCHQREFPTPTASIKNRIHGALIDRHIAVSGAIRDSLVACGISPKKIEVIYNAVNVDKMLLEGAKEFSMFPLEPGRIMLAIFGRVVRWKGQLEVIKAMSGVIKDFPGAMLYIVGDASDAQDDYLIECRDFCKVNNLEPWIKFTGYMDRPFAFMSHMDVIIHNSTSPEPFGRVLVEGMALGKIVLAARLGGPLEIINDGKNGFLADPKNIDEIKEKLCLILGSLKNLDRIRQEARKTVEEKFELRNQAKHIEKIYMDILRIQRK